MEHSLTSSHADIQTYLHKFIESPNQYLNVNKCHSNYMRRNSPLPPWSHPPSNPYLNRFTLPVPCPFSRTVFSSLLLNHPIVAVSYTMTTAVLTTQTCPSLVNSPVPVTTLGWLLCVCCCCCCVPDVLVVVVVGVVVVGFALPGPSTGASVTDVLADVELVFGLPVPGALLPLLPVL